MSEIYRKSSLEKISSPEQLDKMIPVSKVSSWLVLVGISLIISVSLTWVFLGSISNEMNMSGIYMNDGTIEDVFSPLDGQVDEIKVSKGDTVKKGECLAVLKGQEVAAPKDGIVNRINLENGQSVISGQKIAEIRTTSKDAKIVRSYVSLSKAKKLAEGMKVVLVPTTVKEEQSGHITGYIKHISLYGESEEDMYNKLGDELLVNAFRSISSEPVMEVLIALDTNDKTRSGYAWSSKNGESIILDDFTLMSVRVVLSTQTPIEKLTGILH